MRKCVEDGTKAYYSSRSSRLWERRRGSWLADHRVLDALVTFLLTGELPKPIGRGKKGRRS